MAKVFYHNDPDGRCSAYWVRKHLENEKIEFTESDFIEMNYDRPFPWGVLQSNEQVFMVDFCLNDPIDMAGLSKLADLTWIDHHKTAIDKMGNFYVKGIRIDGVAACALTWPYLNLTISDLRIDPEHWISQAPLFTQWIHLWDTWQWKDHESAGEIEAFITALSAYNMHPCSSNWDKL